jgi:hypothetical protein
LGYTEAEEIIMETIARTRALESYQTLPKFIISHDSWCLNARAGTKVIIIRSAGIAGSVTLVESTGVSSNIHTYETNSRGKWRKLCSL